MKNNLKTFPKLPKGWKECDLCKEAFAWKKGFEKELRKMLYERENKNATTLRERERNKIILEVLGE